MPDAIGIRVKTNMQKLEQLYRNVPRRNMEETIEVVQEVADDIHAHWSGEYPPASQPGESPAIRTRALDTSVEVVPQQTGRKNSVLLRVSASGAGALEYGTATMAARPYIRPALERKKATIGKNYEPMLIED